MRISSRRIASIVCSLTILIPLIACQNQAGSRTVSDADYGRPDSGIPNYSTYRYHYPAAAPVLNSAELKRLIDRHRNQVVVLAFWATWSSESRSEIEKLAQLTEKHREEGLRVIACSFDEPDAWGTRVVPMLQAAGANYPCVILPSGERPAMKDWLGADWSADVPARFVVDRRGKTIVRSRGDETILAALNSWGEYTAPRTTPSSRTRLSEPTTAVASRDSYSPTPRSDAYASNSRQRYGYSTVTSSDSYTRTSTGTTVRSNETRYSTPTVARREDSSRVSTVNTTYVTSPAVSVQAKLINVATGDSRSLPVSACGLEDPDCLAETIFNGAASRMERRLNPRVAILPFVRSDRKDDSLGLEVALRVRDGLRQAGYYDLISPKRAESMFSSAGLSPMKADFNPGSIRGKIAADYVIIGWIKGGEEESKKTYLAGEGIGGDDTYSTPRRDEAIYGE